MSPALEIALFCPLLSDALGHSLRREYSNCRNPLGTQLCILCFREARELGSDSGSSQTLAQQRLPLHLSQQRVSGAQSKQGPSDDRVLATLIRRAAGKLCSPGPGHGVTGEESPLIRPRRYSCCFSLKSCRPSLGAQVLSCSCASLCDTACYYLPLPDTPEH